MTPARLVALVLFLVGAARADAQGRVVPEPSTRPRAARVVPAPRQTKPRPVRPPAKSTTRPRAQAPIRKAVPAPATRQPVATPVPPPPRPVPAPVSPITVTLITFGVGPAVWERFGHNALWIHDNATGTDVAYNWGLFDFEQPGFLRRFLTGDTKYWMAGEDAFTMVSAYHELGRTITLQKLNLTPAQAQTLRELVERNALEENKYYRYDYFRDNCSTRLRDAVDRALGGALRAATDTMRTTLTYRSETERLTEGDAPVRTGIDIALGRPADAPLSAWESFFIPMRLRDAVRVVRVPGANGDLVPLVADERVMEPAREVPRVMEPRAAVDHTQRNLMAGAVLAAIFIVLRLLMFSQRWAAWLLALTAMMWSLLCGLLGTALALAWVATKHVFWAWNENLLLVSPLSLALVVLVPMAVIGGRAVRRARIVGLIVAAMALGALALNMTAGEQPNREIIALFLPAQLALGLALLLSMPRRERPAPVPKE